MDLVQIVRVKIYLSILLISMSFIGCNHKVLVDNINGDFILVVEEYQKSEEVLYIEYKVSHHDSLGRMDFRDHLEARVKVKAREYCADKGGLYTIKSKVFIPFVLFREGDRYTQHIQADLSCSDEPWEML